MHLVDDLLNIDADNRLDDVEHSGIGAKLAEHGVEVGRPLHETHDSSQGVVRVDPEEDVLVAVAARVV